MVKIDEIASDVYRISIFVSDFNLQFNHFLIKDDEPMLYHAGMRGMFPMLREAVAKIIDPSQIKWIGASHFEVDEWGGLNEWLRESPQAQAVCTNIGALINLNDYADRAPRGLLKDEILNTGKYSFRIIPTPHLPHGWDAGMLFEETGKILFCSDLFHQVGDVKTIEESDVIDRCRQALTEYQAGPLMDYMPFTSITERLIGELAELKPSTLAAMHGSTFIGDCEKALHEFGGVMKEVLGQDE